MKAPIIRLTTCFLIAMLSSTVMAQESDSSTSYHPFLSDKFHLGIGGFWPQKTVKLRADGSSPGDEINFEEDLGFDESESTTSINFRWRYSKGWSFWAQYWKVDSEGSTVLEENYQWEDVIFKKGTFARAGSDFTVLRLFFGRAFKFGGPRQEFGVGAGLHVIEIDGFIEGEIITGTTTEFHHEKAKATLPLPNIGAWYMYSWSPKWLVDARLDWLSASVGKYSGGLWHAQAGIHYQISQVFGIGFAYANFNLDADVDESDWHGSIETQQYGPRLELTASW
ncbi:MAG: hypothetical protein ACERLB_13650 [Gammaproteobacteria bacterium]